MSAIRVCKRRGCKTHLSRFNPGSMCWEHTPDLTQTDRPASHIMPETHISDRGIMSLAFIRGIPGAYDITPAERRDWARGR
jgi:hypothetical protein